jgi:hypothetical protein
MMWQLAHLAWKIALPSWALIFIAEKTKNDTSSNKLLEEKDFSVIIAAVVLKNVDKIP